MFALRTAQSGPDAPGWTVRVVPNRYPALTSQAQKVQTAGNPYRQVTAEGFHEVIVETPEHDRRLSRFSVHQLETVLAVYRSRLQALSGESKVRSIVLFRNEGRVAGASQEHPHSQILALPLVATRLECELAAAGRHLRRRGRCLTCEVIDRETLDERRLVVQNSVFTALTSFAPRFPYETWILPKSHGHDFGECSTHQIRSLASILKQVLCALESTLGRFPFNLVLQTAPVRECREAERAFHWRFEILPRLTRPSGFELGCDVFIVAVAPEEAAGRLRSALLAESASDNENRRTRSLSFSRCEDRAATEFMSEPRRNRTRNNG